MCFLLLFDGVLLGQVGWKCLLYPYCFFWYLLCQLLKRSVEVPYLYGKIYVFILLVQFYQLFFSSVFVVMDHFFKSFWNLLQYCSCFLFWLFGWGAQGILAPWPKIESAAPALKGKVLTTEPPGKSVVLSFYCMYFDVHIWHRYFTVCINI